MADPPVSILDSMKKLLGYDPAYAAFDEDIKMHINSVLSTLEQLGVGPVGGFAITSADETWEDYMGTKTNLNEVKTYVYLRVKLIFDTPATSFAIEAIKTQITELEWRLNIKQEGVPVV